ncbi:MAG: DUF3576 domain-containing protein [Rickettsiaceae bacterium]|nr:DUF3576 domain-containing protein [Rickettsiaceae bacterium]
MKLVNFYIILLCVFLASSYSLASNYPKSKEEQVREDMGSIFGGDGVVLYSSEPRDKNEKKSSKKHEKTKAQIWGAAKYVLRTMPVIVSDYNSGVIITDWYLSRFQPNYSFKVEIYISQGDLNDIQVRVHERRLDKGQWYNEPENEKLVLQYKEKIAQKTKELLKGHNK